MKKWLGLGVALFCLSVQAGSLKAIVNDTPVFEADLAAHAALLAAQQPSVYGVMEPKELNQKALDNLIEEIVKVQKAESMDIKVSDTDVDNAINHLEQQNGMSVGGLKRLLDESNVPMQTLRQQVYTDLMWLQYVRSQGMRVEIPETAVKAEREKIRSELAKPTFTVAEILVSNMDQAQDLWEQLQSGAIFQELAQKYSKAPSAKNGGKLGVIGADHYGSDVAPVLKEMPVGQLSRPIKVKNGYLLLVMLDKKAPVTSDDIIVWELAQGGLSDTSHADQILKTQNCTEFESAIRQYGAPESYQQGWTDPVQLPTELQDMLSDTAVNQVLGPVRVPQGMLFFMKCNLKTQRVMPSMDEVRTQLEMQQMENYANRLLNQEKRSAVIEYK